MASTVAGMSDNATPWEPPLAGTEAEHLTGALNRMRATFRWKSDGLDAAGLQARIGASSLTLGGLLKHLAINEDYMFTVKLSGEPIGGPWRAAGWDGSEDDWEFTTAADDSPGQFSDHSTIERLLTCRFTSRTCPRRWLAGSARRGARGVVLVML
jgi:hypothetical protein